MLTEVKTISAEEFKNLVLTGIPNELPAAKEFDKSLNHAPKRKEILNPAEKKLAL